MTWEAFGAVYLPGNVSGRAVGMMECGVEAALLASEQRERPLQFSVAARGLCSKAGMERPAEPLPVLQSKARHRREETY